MQKLTFILFLFMIGCSNPVIASPTLEDRNIQLVDCNNCLAFTIGFLKFQIPNSDLKSFNVLNSSEPTVSVEFSHASKMKLLMFLILSEDNATGGLKVTHYKKLLVKDVTGFFDKIGSAKGGRALQDAREIMGINDAHQYLRYKQRGMNAYWIKSKDMKNQKLFIISSKLNNVYLVAGNLDSRVVNNLLSNVQIVK